MLKWCPRCESDKDTSEFHKNRRQSDGFQSYCKECMKPIQADYRIDNRDKMVEAVRQWHLVHKPPHPRPLLPPEHHKRVKRFHREKRKALMLNAYVEDVDSFVVLERDDGICGICMDDVDPMDFHLDHVFPLSLGGEHSYANVQVAHPFCNISKNNRV